jgi:hypothetical protein
MIKTDEQAINELKQLVGQLDENSTLFSVLGMVTTIIEDGHLSGLDETLRDKFSDFYTDMCLNEPSHNV